MSLVVAVVMVVGVALVMLGGAGWWIDRDADAREDVTEQR